MVQTEDNEYCFIGRSKDLIVQNATNISPVEVENVLMQHPAVADAAVAGAPDVKAGQRVVALVTLTDNPVSRSAVATEIRQWIEARIAAFKVPEQILVVDVIPRNALGKVDRVQVTRIVTSIEL